MPFGIFNPRKNFLIGVNGTGTTGSLTTTFEVLNTTNFPSLVVNQNDQNKWASYDAVTGVFEFFTDAIIENDITINGVGGASVSVVEYIPEIWDGVSWSQLPARLQNVPGNSDQQQIIVGARQVSKGHKLRLKVRASSGTVELASVPITDGVISSTISAFTWIQKMDLI